MEVESERNSRNHVRQVERRPVQSSVQEDGNGHILEVRRIYVSWELGDDITTEKTTHFPKGIRETTSEEPNGERSNGTEEETKY